VEVGAHLLQGEKENYLTATFAERLYISRSLSDRPNNSYFTVNIRQGGYLLRKYSPFHKLAHFRVCMIGFMPVLARRDSRFI